MKEFKSFGAFAAHLSRMAVAMPTLTAEIAERVGEAVEARAKSEIGTYQPAVGEFKAWAPLTAQTEARKAVLGYPSNAPLLATGEMRDSIGYTVARRMLGATVSVGSTEQKMIYHEFGTPKMPPRPVIGPAMFHERDHFEKVAAELLFAFLIGKNWKKGK